MSKEVVLFSVENDKMIQFEDGKRWLSCSKCLFRNIDCCNIPDELIAGGVGSCKGGGYYGTDND